MAQNIIPTLQPARDEIFNWYRSEQHQRNPEGLQSSAQRLDGQESLWESVRCALSTDVTEILDLLHGSSYVWKAAQVLFPSRSFPKKIPFVKKQVGRILNGHVVT